MTSFMESSSPLLVYVVMSMFFPTYEEDELKLPPALLLIVKLLLPIGRLANRFTLALELAGPLKGIVYCPPEVLYHTAETIGFWVKPPLNLTLNEEKLELFE